MAENNIMNVLDLSEETKKYIATLYPQDVSFDTRLLSIYRTLLEEQKKQPYSINLVSLIGADENAHSRVLCRLLQYPGEKATYPFAIDFISKFISPDVAEQVSGHAGRYKLEIYQEKQRMDLQLFMPGIVGIIIENKNRYFWSIIIIFFVWFYFYILYYFIRFMNMSKFSNFLK